MRLLNKLRRRLGPPSGTDTTQSSWPSTQQFSLPSADPFASVTKTLAINDARYTDGSSIKESFVAPDLVNAIMQLESGHSEALDMAEILEQLIEQRRHAQHWQIDATSHSFTITLAKSSAGKLCKDLTEAGVMNSKSDSDGVVYIPISAHNAAALHAMIPKGTVAQSVYEGTGVAPASIART